MPLPLIPLGYAAVAAALTYGGKKLHERIDEVQVAIENIKDAATAKSTAVKDATEAAAHMKESAESAITKLTVSGDDFKNVLLVVLGAWAAVAAFYVGLMSGLGIHFLRLIDKTTLFHELVFYGTIVSALRAPAALVAALVARSAQSKAIDLTRPALAIAAFLASVVFLDAFYALCFWLAVATLFLLTLIRVQAAGRSFFTVCALLFGYLYAETLILQKADTKIILSDSRPTKLTLLMSTPRGLIGLDENKQMAQYAWTSVVSVSVEPEAAKLIWLREALKTGRAAFANILRLKGSHPSGTQIAKP